MLQEVQDAIKANDLGRLDRAIQFVARHDLLEDEGVQAGVKHLVFLKEERALVDMLERVRHGLARGCIASSSLL